MRPSMLSSAWSRPRSWRLLRYRLPSRRGSGPSQPERRRPPSCRCRLAGGRQLEPLHAQLRLGGCDGGLDEGQRVRRNRGFGARDVHNAQQARRSRGRGTARRCSSTDGRSACSVRHRKSGYCGPGPGRFRGRWCQRWPRTSRRRPRTSCLRRGAASRQSPSTQRRRPTSSPTATSRPLSWLGRTRSLWITGMMVAKGCCRRYSSSSSPSRASGASGLSGLARNWTERCQDSSTRLRSPGRCTLPVRPALLAESGPPAGPKPVTPSSSWPARACRWRSAAASVARNCWLIRFPHRTPLPAHRCARRDGMPRWIGLPSLLPSSKPP